jgi:hypothetical protein
MSYLTSWKVHMYVYIMSHDFNIMSHVCILDSWLLYNVTWLLYNVTWLLYNVTWLQYNVTYICILDSWLLYNVTWLQYNYSPKCDEKYLGRMEYQICVIIICWEKCDEKCAYMFNVYIEHICTFFVTFFSTTIDDRDLIFHPSVRPRYFSSHFSQ